MELYLHFKMSETVLRQRNIPDYIEIGNGYRCHRDELILGFHYFSLGLINISAWNT